MIAYIEGKLVESMPKRVVVEARGSGLAYEITIALTTYSALPELGEVVKILTYLHTTENSQTLFGFLSEEERDLFKILIKVVSGIGPKIAIAVLSGIKVDDFKRAIGANDADTLAKINGIGKKTAQRMILELQDKVGSTEVWQGQSHARQTEQNSNAKNDAYMALIALGYSKSETQKAFAKLDEKVSEDMTSAELIRLALRHLS